MKTPSSIVFFIGLLALGPAFAASPSATAAETLQKMSLRQRVGQLFLVGFSQKHLDPTLEKFIRENQPGGFVLFRRNLSGLDVTREFTSKLTSLGRTTSGVLPFLAVDQEGGSVTRIPLFPSLPSAYAIGSSADESLARGFGNESGKLLRWAGFNLNLAPVLDLSDPLKTTFLGPRSFSADPDITGPLGLAYAKGLRESGILPTGKHFPGLGSSEADLHKSTASRQVDVDFFKRNDLRPFSDFVGLGNISAVMISQMSYPALDPSGKPASFSSKIMEDLLRKEMSFKGLVMTDDLQMKGSALLYRPETAALESLRAGADLIMISWSFQDQARAMNHVIGAIKKGEWSETQLNERVLRILEVKQALAETPIIPLKIAKGPDGNPGTRRLEELDLQLLDAKLKSLSLRRPAALANGRICTVSSDERFLNSFREGRKQGVTSILVRKETSVSQLENSLTKNCPTIIFAVTGASTSKFLRSFASKTLARIYAVNLGLPTLIPMKTALAGRLEIGYPHLHAGFRVAKLFGP